jgi:mannosyltransferase OCH1-like enzyme
MIPKTIHHIWIGNNPLPVEFKQFRNKWMELYPDYNFIFWNDEMIESSNLLDDSIKKYYYSDYKIAFKVDLLRFKILKKFGGLYIDCDTEPLKRMPDNFLNYKFFAGRQIPYTEVAIGILGSEPDNQLVNDYNTEVLESIKLNTDENGVVSNELWKITGPSFFNQLCNRYIDDIEYKFFENKYFYPYGWDELNRRFENFSITCPDAYSVHHWAHSWW